MQKKYWLSGLVLALFLTGCVTTSEGDRVLNHQNIMAGAYVKAKAVDPAVAQAGDDIGQNSVQLAETIGVPANPPAEYTPEVSAAARDQSKEEHAVEGAWVQIARDVAAPVPWAGTAISLLVAGGALIRKRLQDRKLVALYDGVQKVKERVEDKDYASAVTEIMRNAAVAHKVYTEVKKDIVGLRKIGSISTT